MKKNLLVLAVILFTAISFTSCKENDKKTDATETEAAATATESAQEYAIDIAASKITWMGSKPTGSHNGTIAMSSGMVYALGSDLQSGNFTINMNSITDLSLDAGMKENLEAHLKGTVEGKEGDFFNVTKYPTAKFELTGVAGESGNITVSGNLTIKDKTNPVSFPATISFPEDKIFLKSETFTIDRTKWGVNYGSKNIFDNLGDKFINDEIELTIELHGKKS